jgi:L-lactate dehydrogenase complex protein LldE
MRVALFLTCVNDTAFPDTGRAVVLLLERLGVEVDFPAGQSCCGQAHFNTGYRDLAASLAARHEEVFAGYDAVVTPSASCAAMVRDHHPGLTGRAHGDRTGSGGGDGHGRAVPPTYELTEFLVDVLGVTDVGAYFPYPVTYHPTCHGLRMLGLGTRPHRLLRAVEGLELLELPDGEQCCGFGGTFALKNPEVSTAMGRDKIGNAEATGARVLAAADNSCLMHLGGLMARQDSPVRPLHIAEILASTRQAPYPLPQDGRPVHLAAADLGAHRRPRRAASAREGGKLR